MAAHFGTFTSLQQLEAGFYAGADGSCDLPPKRWRFLQKDSIFREAVLTRDQKKERGESFFPAVPIDSDFPELVNAVAVKNVAPWDAKKSPVSQAWLKTGYSEDFYTCVLKALVFAWSMDTD